MSTSTKKTNKAALSLGVLLSLLVAVPEAALAVYSSSSISVWGMMQFGLPVYAISYLMYKPDLINLAGSWLSTTRADHNSYNFTVNQKKTLNIFLLFTCSVLSVLYFNSVYIPLGILAFDLPSSDAVWKSSILNLKLISAFFSAVVFVANYALYKPIVFEFFNNLKQKLDKFIQTSFTIKNILSRRSLNNLHLKNIASNILVLKLTGAAFLFTQMWLFSEVYSFLNSMVAPSLNLTESIVYLCASAVSVLGFMNAMFYAKNVYKAADFLFGTKNNTEENTTGQTIVPTLPAQDFQNNKPSLINLASFGILAAFCVINASAVSAPIMGLVGSSIIMQYFARTIIFTASMVGNAVPAAVSCGINNASDLQPSRICYYIKADNSFVASKVKQMVSNSIDWVAEKIGLHDDGLFNVHQKSRLD